VWTPKRDRYGISDKVFGVHSPSINDAGGLGTPVVVDGNSYTDPIQSFSGYVTTGVAAVSIAAPPAGTAPTGITATVARWHGDLYRHSSAAGSVGYTAADTASGGQAVTAVLQGAGALATASLGTTLLTSNEIVSILVTNGGSGYTVAPTVHIAPPDIAGGTQATATANIAGGAVVSITIGQVGSGYTTTNPAVTFTSVNTAAVDGRAHHRSQRKQPSERSERSHHPQLLPQQQR